MQHTKNISQNHVESLTTANIYQTYCQDPYGDYDEQTDAFSILVMPKKIHEVIKPGYSGLLLDYRGSTTGKRRYGSKPVPIYRDMMQGTYTTADGNRALIYPGVKLKQEQQNVNNEIEDKNDGFDNTTHDELNELSLSSMFTNRFGNTPYNHLIPTFSNALEILGNHGFTMTPRKLDQLINIVLKENGTFTHSRINYTPIGQVGRPARIDAQKYLHKVSSKIHIGNRGKRNYQEQILATIGYMGVCGFWKNDTMSKQHLAECYTKYNLGPWYQTNIETTRKNAQNQAYASHIKQPKMLPQIEDAAYNYYTDIA